MKVLLVIMPYILGSDGVFSGEYFNYYCGLKKIVTEVEIFDYYKTLREQGKIEMNNCLLNKVKESNPDIVFVVLNTYEFIPEIMDEIKKLTITFGFFHDDIWRQDYAKEWAQHFSYILLTDPYGDKKFHSLGVKNVIVFPQACNHFVYTPKDTIKEYDVSFIGGYHPYRSWLIKCLRKQGINVKIFGNGWGNDKLMIYLSNKISSKLKRIGLNFKPSEERTLSHDEMIEIINKSKISLNLPNSTNWDLRYLLSSPMALINTLRSKKNIDGIKLRHFEISTCKGFQLAYYEEGLEKYYIISDEIAIFLNVDGLVEKVKYYLKHENERENIADNGYRRVIKDHTIEKRFNELFKKVGINNPNRVNMPII